MKAIRLQRLGGPDELRFEEIATPAPGENEVLIQVHAAGLNYTDLGQREGRFPTGLTLPFTPGYEAAGEVVATGPGVTKPAVGTRVVAMLPQQGALAEYAVAPAALAAPLPAEVSYAQAVALPVQGTTALLALKMAARITGGESVFIPAAAGGVGSFLVQLAKRLGASAVIAGASSETKRALAKRLGADATVDYTRPNWAERVKEATGGRGADVVFEMSGGETGDESLRALAPLGRLVVFGADNTQGTTRLTNEQIIQLMLKNQAYVGFSTVNLPPELKATTLAELFDHVAKGQLEVIVGQTFPLAEAAAAHRALASRATTGKVVLMPFEPFARR